MERALTVAAVLTRICDWAARLAAIVLVLLVFVVMYSVIQRSFLTGGSVYSQDLQWHLHGVVALLAIGFGYTRDAHVRIDVLADCMAPRFRFWLELWVLALFVLPFLALLIWYGYDMAERAFLRGEGANGGRGLPHRWVIKSVVPLSALLTMLGCLAVMTRLIGALFRPDLITKPFVTRPLWKH